MVNKELKRIQTTAMQIAAEVNNLEFESDGRDTCSIVHNLKSRGKYKLDYNIKDGITIRHKLEYHYDEDIEKLKKSLQRSDSYGCRVLFQRKTEQMREDMYFFEKEKAILESILRELKFSRPDYHWKIFTGGEREIQNPYTTQEMREEIERYKSNIEQLKQNI